MNGFPSAAERAMLGKPVSSSELAHRRQRKANRA